VPLDNAPPLNDLMKHVQPEPIHPRGKHRSHGGHDLALHSSGAGQHRHPNIDALIATVQEEFPSSQADPVEEAKPVHLIPFDPHNNGHSPN
jgi:hypothetical protein